MFSAWSNGDSQTLLQLVLCSKLTQCQENADLTMYGFMMKSYKGWLEKYQDTGRAKSTLCRKAFDISNMGETELSSHAKGAKHQSAAACSTAPNPITGFFTRVTDVTPAPSCGAALSSTAKQGYILSAVFRN